MPEIELVPISAIFLLDVEILVMDFMSRRFDLDIATSAEFYIFPFGQLKHQVLDEGCHILVGANGAFPFLYTEDLFWNLDAHILLDRHLTGQAITRAGLSFGDMSFLGGQDGPAPFKNLATALGHRFPRHHRRREQRSFAQPTHPATFHQQARKWSARR